MVILKGPNQLEEIMAHLKIHGAMEIHDKYGMYEMWEQSTNSLTFTRISKDE